jgi:hypothetical protein
MQKLLRFASLYCDAATQSTMNNTHAWAADIVNEAFQRVMGRAPTPAERQIVLAVSNLESGYGRGWKGSGAGSHNWGAVQTRNEMTPQFQYRDSSAEGSYVIGFKVYRDDVGGAADVVRLLFKSDRKQQMPDEDRAQRTLGGEIAGPGRGELIEQAAQQGDTTAFSRAMWYTTYFEGRSPDFVKNIKSHAKGIQARINKIAAAIGEAPAWSIKTQNYLPVTSNQDVIKKILEINPKAGEGVATAPPQSPATNVQVPSAEQPFPAPTPAPQAAQIAQPPEDDFSGIESMVWFQ